MDALKLLNAQIDMKNNTFTTTHSQHPIRYTQNPKTIYRKTKYSKNLKNPLTTTEPPQATLNATDTHQADFDQRQIDSVINEILDEYNQRQNRQENDTNSVIANANDETDTNNTVHSNIESNISLTIPIIKGPVNHGNNQIIISEVEHSPAKPITTTLFGNKQRTIVQFSTQNFEKEFVKEKIIPKIRYQLFFENNCYEKFCNIMTKNFRTSEINFTKYTHKLIDILEPAEIKEIIDKYHISKTNHRGAHETYTRIKTTYFWPNQKSTIQTCINPVY